MEHEITISRIGLERSGITAYVAHEKGNWTQPGSDYREHPMFMCGEHIFSAHIELEPDEQFKVVIEGLTEAEAKKIFALRLFLGITVGRRFDYDTRSQTFWLLAPAYPVINWGKWNQNNVVPTE